jgi:hypothetical protein
MATDNTAIHKNPPWMDAVVLRLQDPDLLRMTILGFIGVVGLGLAGIPIYNRITTLQEMLSCERERDHLIRDHNLLESKLMQYKKRLPKDASLDWWIQYILDAGRQWELKITEFKPSLAQGPTSQIGKRKGTLLRFEIVGPFSHILHFIGWLENQKTIVRIALISIVKDSPSAPPRSSVTLAVLTEKTLAQGSPSGGKTRARKKVSIKGSKPAQAEKAGGEASDGNAADQ